MENNDSLVDLIYTLEKEKDTNNKEKIKNKILQWIDSGKYDVSLIDDEETALTVACAYRMSDIALKLIQTGNSRPEYINQHGVTALVYACDNRMKEVALKLIETGKSLPEHICEENGTTALISACDNSMMSDVAIKLIETGKSLPEHIDNTGDTALIVACYHPEMSEVIFKLIETGKSLPDHIDDDGNTALIIACENKMNEVALKLIETGKSLPEHISNNGTTALILACHSEMSEVALKLIETDKSLPEHIDNVGNTALIWTCFRSMKEVALKLIETGKSLPEHICKNGITALTIACERKLSEIALKLIETGKSLPDHINNNNLTSLIYACQNSMNEVAVKLIETGKSLPDHIDNNGNTALIWAIKRNMTDVAELIKKEIIKIKSININDKGFDVVNQEYIKISDYLNDTSDGICIKVNNQYFLTEKKTLLMQMKNKANIKYGCRVEGNGSRFILDDNIIYDKTYFSMSAIFGLQILVDIKTCTNILDTSNLFYLTPSQTKFKSIISKEFIDGGSGVGADHCQPGKETVVYNINKANPICSYGEKKEGKEEEKGKEEGKEQIKVQYKTNMYSFPITPNATLDTIKQQLLHKLTSENIIPKTVSSVKFIYKGKMYTDMNVVISTIEPNPNGMTLQSMISFPSGGRRKTKKRNSRKTNHHKITRKSEKSKIRKWTLKRNKK